MGINGSILAQMTGGFGGSFVKRRDQMRAEEVEAEERRQRAEERERGFGLQQSQLDRMLEDAQLRREMFEASQRPPVIHKPWEKEGFPDEESWLASKGRAAAAIRAPTPAPPPRNIDPNSPEGIAAAIERAKGTAQATAPFRAGSGADARPPRAPTEGQEKSHIFYGLMRRGEDGLQGVTSRPDAKIRPEAIRAALMVPFGAGAVVLNADEQEFMKHARDFAAGVLRKETGAQIRMEELQDVFARYIDAPFEAPNVRKVKRDSRLQYIELMRQSALPASKYYQEIDSTGRPPRDTVVDDLIRAARVGRPPQ